MHESIRVNPNSPHNFHGPGALRRARAFAREHGAAGHMRPDGRFTLYYRDGSKLRQRTWRQFRLSEPVHPWNHSA